jgi:hypothetical protein
MANLTDEEWANAFFDECEGLMQQHGRAWRQFVRAQLLARLKETRVSRVPDDGSSVPEARPVK